MKAFTYISIRILIIIGILLIFNLIYEIYFFEEDVRQYSDITELLEQVDEDCKVLYLGESSNFTSGKFDLDKRSISEFTSEYYPDLKFSTIDKPASHGEVYKFLLKQIPEYSSIETVIVTLNMRSFGPDWIYSDLENLIQKNLLLHHDRAPLFNRFLLSFKAYDQRNEQDRKIQIRKEWEFKQLRFPFNFEYQTVSSWNRAMAKKGVSNPDGSKNQELTNLACHYIKTYAFQIDTNDNPRIRDFDEIVTLSKRKGWKLVFNLLGENIEQAEYLVGEEISYLMRQNCELLVDRYTAMGVLVIDNSDKVPDIEFADRDWTTEHYNEQGRKIVAKNIAEGLKEIYENEFVSVSYESKIKDKYFYDLEGTIPANQSQSISIDNAYSGNHSSKTGKGVEFSFTLERPLKASPDSTINYIDISCQLFLEGISPDIKLVVELQGENTSFSWNGESVISRIETTHQWKLFNYRYVLSEENKKADFLKIYLYNPTGHIVYMDDLEVIFN